MIARPPRLSPTDTRFPYTALFRAAFGKKAHHFAARKAQAHLLGRVTNRMAPPPRQKDSARAGHQPAYDGPLAHVVFRDERHAAHAVQHEAIEPPDRKSGGQRKRMSVRVDLGGRRTIKKKKTIIKA